MTSYLYAHQIRIFDYPRFAEPLRDAIRINAEHLASENGIDIEFVRKSHIRKEDIITKVLERRGSHPGLVHILSAMEACQSYKPWHNKTTGKTFLKPDTGKCLYYYFYFIDQDLGLCYIRVPTWRPFRLQFYFNGHQMLAHKLTSSGIAFILPDNAFTDIEDFGAAQKLSNDLDIAGLHSRFDEYARLYCPVVDTIGVTYHWSIMQAEYATDIVLKRRADLQPIYQTITRTSHPYRKTKPDCHLPGPAIIKMYDKFGLVLRIGTTINDPSFCKHHRWVEQKNGPKIFKRANLKKSIYSLNDLRLLLMAANQRYLAFISEIDHPSAGHAYRQAGRNLLQKVTEPKKVHGRTYKGLNFFSKTDQRLCEIIMRGEYNISGMRNKDLKRFLSDLTSGQISRRLKNLLVHGIIKRVRNTYKYYLTRLGRRVIITALSFKEQFVVPQLAIAEIV